MPHNSLAGFRKAAELGADMVELDVQRCADRNVAVIHDMNLRTSDGRFLTIRQTDYEELREIDLGGGEHIPTLLEVLAVCRQRDLGVYIELKDGLVAPLVIEALNEVDFIPRCLVCSFHPDWVADFKAALPEVETSILFSSRAIDGPRAVHLAQSCGATLVHPCWERFPYPSSLLTPEWIGAVRAAGLRIITWHEERPAEIAALKALGVDGICSDRPELLRDAD
jgi:glycerophosphoryl diester phosphodiesterase